jgi:hypothetical protein
MRQAILTAAMVLTLSASTARAESENGRIINDDMVAGQSLLEQGAKIFLRGLMAEVEPALDDMALALKEAEPMLRDLMGMVQNINDYHAPEMMPNGDILIRKKTAQELAAEDPVGEIEL